jgi:type I restriction enzyme, S subunit
MRRPLRDLADVHYGRSPNEVVHEDGSIPVVGTGGVYGRAVRPLFQGPAIVVPRKGSLGNPQYMSGPFWAVDTTYAVLPKKGVHTRWLHYNLAHFDLTRLNEATGVPSISRDWLFKILFEDPGEEAQSRIAEILSTVDEAIEQTEAVIAKTQQIKAGLMHDLFSRGVTADGQLRPPREEAPHLYKESPLGWIPKDWDIRPLRQCLLDNPTNGIYKPAAQIGRGTLLVGQTSFTEERSVDFSVARRAVVSTDELRRYSLAEGNILLSRVFATLDGVGQPTLVPPLPEPAVYESNMMRLRIDQVKIPPRLLFEWLRGHRARRLIVAGANASNQSSINQQVLNPLPVLTPPQDEQARILAAIEADDFRAMAERESLHKLRGIKAAVMHDLLSGSASVAAPESVEVRSAANV